MGSYHSHKLFINLHNYRLDSEKYKFKKIVNCDVENPTLKNEIETNLAGEIY